MAFSTSGQSLSSFRERTDKTTKSMPGVSFLTFKCKKCGGIKPVQGRKSLGHKSGFKCAECSAKAMSAA